jgi:hypothetical protein
MNEHIIVGRDKGLLVVAYIPIADSVQMHRLLGKLKQNKKTMRNKQNC